MEPSRKKRKDVYLNQWLFGLGSFIFLFSFKDVLFGGAEFKTVWDFDFLQFMRFSGMGLVFISYFKSIDFEELARKNREITAKAKKK